jgi:cyclophilin family peptidyl-prolyl cis-trans isomerase
MDVSVGGQPAGRIVLGLFGDNVPKTAANFAALGKRILWSLVSSAVTATHIVESGQLSSHSNNFAHAQMPSAHVG